MKSFENAYSSPFAWSVCHGPECKEGTKHNNYIFNLITKHYSSKNMFAVEYLKAVMNAYILLLNKITIWVTTKWQDQSNR